MHVNAFNISCEKLEPNNLGSNREVLQQNETLNYLV